MFKGQKALPCERICLYLIPVLILHPRQRLTAICSTFGGYKGSEICTLLKRFCPKCLSLKNLFKGERDLSEECACLKLYFPIISDNMLLYIFY